MTNPFGPPPQQPAQQPPAAPPASPFGPPAQQPQAQPAYAPPTQQPVQQGPAPYGQPGQPGQPGSSQWPAGATPAPTGTPGGPPAALAGNFVPVGPPPPSGDGAGAKLADMYGRLVMFLPQVLERGLPSSFRKPDGTPRTQDRITACAVVLDGGQDGPNAPIRFGGDMTVFPQKPHTESAPLPYVRKGLYIWQNSIIRQIEAWLPGGANAPADGRTPGTALGRVWKDGPERTDPWYLLDATAQDIELANYYLAAVQAGQFPHPLA